MVSLVLAFKNERKTTYAYGEPPKRRSAAPSTGVGGTYPDVPAKCYIEKHVPREPIGNSCSVFGRLLALCLEYVPFQLVTRNAWHFR